MSGIILRGTKCLLFTDLMGLGQLRDGHIFSLNMSAALLG